MVEMESIGVLYFTQNLYYASNPSAWKVSKNDLMCPFLHHVSPRKRLPIFSYLIVSSVL